MYKPKEATVLGCSNKVQTRHAKCSERGERGRAGTRIRNAKEDRERERGRERKNIKTYAYGLEIETEGPNTYALCTNI